MAGPYGALFGGIGGAFLGVLAPEIAETLDQGLGTDKDPSDKRETDIAGGPDTPVGADVPRVDDLVGDQPVGDQMEFTAPDWARTPGIAGPLNPRLAPETPRRRR